MKEDKLFFITNNCKREGEDDFSKYSANFFDSFTYEYLKLNPL